MILTDYLIALGARLRRSRRPRVFVSLTVGGEVWLP